MPVLAQSTVAPIVRTIDLNLGESAIVELRDGSSAQIKLLELTEHTNSLRGAIRTAVVKVEVNGRVVELSSGNYNLPKWVGGVQIDCPITGGYLTSSHRDRWALKKEARLRFWPADSPLIDPTTFTYPVK
ncbi:hypothetical protein F7C95_00645 [Opitutia bacterium ISCC 51]|nr:hypothetical protein F7C95_00645 [Opitutae bacterium ISCC 51]QXD28524.1 hypothetical protein GA003_00640 [Opitutae bacterium ISCC 52]